jgi:type I site-specific restriction endonuclease
MTEFNQIIGRSTRINEDYNRGHGLALGTLSPQ